MHHTIMILIEIEIKLNNVVFEQNITYFVRIVFMLMFTTILWENDTRFSPFFHGAAQPKNCFHWYAPCMWSDLFVVLKCNYINIDK